MTVVHGYPDMFDPDERPEWALALAEMRHQSQHALQLHQVRLDIDGEVGVGNEFSCHFDHERIHSVTSTRRPARK